MGFFGQWNLRLINLEVISCGNGERMGYVYRSKQLVVLKSILFGRGKDAGFTVHFTYAKSK